MWKRQRIYNLALALGMCFFIYSCGGEESEAPPPVVKQDTDPSVPVAPPEVSQEEVTDSPGLEIQIDELILQLEGDDEKAAYNAALKLALIGGETAVQPLMSAYESESPLVRIGAIKALGSIGDERALEILLVALGDSVVDVRRNAATGLGVLGDESAVGPLIEALKDQDDRVREGAKASLKKITNQDFPDYAAWNEWY